jgi:predicted tellurium resistance membrane protein TerC
VSWQNFIDFSWTTNPGAWIGLISLIALEIVLGIDNIVFISILAGKLPPEQQSSGRRTGLILAVVPRLLLLLALPFVLSLEHPFVTLPVDDFGKEGYQPLGVSVQDAIVLIGGLFLVYKATHEIHEKLEGDEHPEDAKVKAGASYSAIMVQIMLLNIVFSLDSIVTAIGMVPKEQVVVMMIAVLVATVVMAYTVNTVSVFVEQHPTVKMLALSFLLLIGTTLIIEAFHVHVPKGYVYFAMGFSVLVEMLNLRASARKKRSQPVHLHGPSLGASSETSGEASQVSAKH